MNFQQLCKRTAQESGTIAGLPSFSTVAGATGRLEKLVGWVSQAWVDIQNERTDWIFRIGEFSGNLSIDQAAYSPSNFAADVLRFLPDTAQRRSITLYDPAIGRSDEGHINQIAYDLWRTRYDIGTHDLNRPTVWALKPDGSLAFGNTPDKEYMVRGLYRKRAQVLELDTDEPIIPEDFHTVIVQEALRLMARSDEAWAALVPISQQYDRTRSALVRDQTPEVYFLGGDGPLA